MSSAYAIAGVTAVLQRIIDQGITEHGVITAIGTNVVVSALSPDRVPNYAGLNLFFYQVTPNLGWRNECLPSRNSRSESIANQPLALDLHYLISANGASDLFSEILLGSAMQTLHEKPFLDRNAIRDFLTPPPLPQTDPILNALDESGLADQLEQIKVTPEYLSNEDMSKLWSAVQSNYRPSVAYLATVVLIEAENPSVSPLPVLTRSINAIPSLIPPTPTMMAIEYPDQQISARLGETIGISGFNLNGTNVRVKLQMLSTEQVGDFPLLPNANNERVEFVLPNDAAVWRAGIYQLSLTMDNNDGNPIESNNLALTIAPKFSNFNAIRNINTESNRPQVVVTITTTPEVHDTQSVSMILGQTQQSAKVLTVPVTKDVSFEFPDIPAGNYWARVRVDGIDSILINRAGPEPKFHLDHKVVVPV